MQESLKRAEELLELHDLLSKIREDSLAKVKTDQDRLLESLESFDIVKARKKTKPAKKTKEHWKVRDKKRREARRRHYVSEKNKRKYEWKQIFEQVKNTDTSTAEGYAFAARAWYNWLGRESTRMAHKRRKGWKVTEEEFRTYVWPALLDGEGNPKIPVMQRYDKDGLWELPNMYLTVDGSVVFDGKEYLLRSLGYII
jgi:hypothetical protein